MAIYINEFAVQAESEMEYEVFLCQRALTNEEWICAATMAVVATCGATDLEKGDIPWYDPNCSMVKDKTKEWIKESSR